MGSRYPYQQAPVRPDAPTTMRGGGPDARAIPGVWPTVTSIYQNGGPTPPGPTPGTITGISQTGFGAMSGEQSATLYGAGFVTPGFTDVTLWDSAYNDLGACTVVSFTDTELDILLPANVPAGDTYSISVDFTGLGLYYLGGLEFV